MNTQRVARSMATNRQRRSHPRQVLDIHVQEARFVILEGFDLWLNLAGISQRLGLQLTQIGHAMATQAAIQSRA